ncbi:MULTISPECIES: ABC transporter ATP-binding protein [Pirellulaceae]|uniref:Putative ABC transport system ATP-binding protein n=1 Tax=Aporhodopirellula rubra TaxID=980271 RepID=A0A7W5H9M3_9BACT|nr:MULTISPECIES: ABC transporter ATP-binding protein [Pirellulaceae]EMI46416.1 ABC transporter (glutamine transport ATP-binding protein) [Rhodopirellula sp. SWK7]MBB3210246.1 putative ABC transport system ATP-binding protein [Aporhodopirellula rubra]
MNHDESVLLAVDDVCKDYPDGNVHALDHVSFEIHSGEYVAIMGPSGSGKSTLLSILGTLDRPTSGKVIFEGKVVDSSTDLDELRSRSIGFIFQSFYLLPTLTALENVQVPMFGRGMTGAQRIEKARELINAVGMNDRAKHLPKQLSVGQRQRIAIARSLANDPRLLLADEPTGNLDTVTAAGILDLFNELHDDRKMTLVTVTHSEEVALAAQRVLRVRDGRIESDERNKTLQTS